MTAREITVPHRFRGPDRSGNGGWTAGSLAPLVPAAGPHTGRPATVEVTLRLPPPLDEAMPVAVVPPGEDAKPHAVPLAVLGTPDGAGRVAEARAVDGPLDPVDRVDADEAAAAMTRFAGLRRHPFPGCFTCGPDRAEGDGLRIFPGPVGEDTVASRWVPDPSLAEPSGPGTNRADDSGVRRVSLAAAWAALDCPGGWSEDLEGRPAVLGRMTARVDALPVVGEPHVVVGRRLRREGRKTFTAATLYDADGRVVATAAHVWIAVDPAAFG